ncbi:cupin domain-containing protein [Enterovibrio sp. ZSDZ35]|uniref:Cupin domain-containing protein n=1 Tax=Enterovibrio qingdaonensis TaxID=2899818 RepID=A0ABT5QTE6_9GAMM|nr:cupin domain-containing protein [Enterovibrio sp. ZSDZ35]MDD1784254.1 cupin domain-containing protein [Enterovibrio sp. ZSDZ35]
MRLLLILAAMLGTTSLSASENLGSTDPLLDNEAVQAVRHTYPPGSESGMHSHDYPFRVVYVLEGGTAEIVPQDSTKATRTITFKEGMTMYVPAATHNVRNVGETQIRLLEIELKP